MPKIVVIDTKYRIIDCRGKLNRAKFVSEDSAKNSFQYKDLLFYEKNWERLKREKGLI